jgi:hypothetical protein
MYEKVKEERMILDWSVGDFYLDLVREGSKNRALNGSFSRDSAWEARQNTNS